MFSARTNWELSENPLSLALDGLKARGIGVLDLTESNPTRAGFSYPAQAIVDALSDRANLQYEPLAQGMLTAREAVAAYYGRRNIVIDPRHLTLTASSSEAYTFLFRLLADHGDKILLPAPSYPLFAYLAGLNDVEPLYYRLHFNDEAWELDTDSIISAAEQAKGRARAIVLVSPNNPTGSFMRREDFVRLNEICARFGLAIISDEVFSDYIWGGHSDEFASAAGNDGVLSFALGGLSKALALPQMKLGWIAANGPEGLRKEALARLDVIADTYLSVNTPVQRACAAWLRLDQDIQGQILRRVTGNFAYLQSALRDSGIFLYPVEGGWYAVIRSSRFAPEDEWALGLLKEKHVYAHPGFYFDFAREGHVVLSLLPKEEVFQEGIGRLLNFR